MNRRRRLVFLLSLVLVLFGAAVTARAAGEKKEENPAAGHAGELFKWLNFAIVAGGIGYLVFKAGPQFFRGRAEQIAAAITQAAAVKAAADRQVQEAETRLARLPQEVAELRADAQREAAAESERLRAATGREVAKIAAAGQAEIEAAERVAHLELKAFAARLAVDGAESLLARQLTPTVQESLVKSFVQSLAGRPN